MTKSHDRMQSHTMELPRLIEIGEKNIGDFGKFVNSL
ncbi:MAG: glycerol-1-phosphate dehydrogenase, partial [Thermoproteota archaeon]